LRNLPGDIVLHREQFGCGASVSLAPELFSVTYVIEFDIDREVVTALHDPAREYGLNSQAFANFLEVCGLTFVAKCDAIWDDF